VRKLDEIRRRVGDHPAFWWPELVGDAYPAALPDLAPLPLRSAS
jgi:type IV secretion system protein VirB4